MINLEKHPPFLQYAKYVDIMNMHDNIVPFAPSGRHSFRYTRIHREETLHKDQSTPQPVALYLCIRFYHIGIYI